MDPLTVAVLAYLAVWTLLGLLLLAASHRQQRVWDEIRGRVEVRAED